MANARLKLARVKTRKRRRSDAGSEEASIAEVPVPLSRSNSQNCVQEEPETSAIASEDDVATALFDRKKAIETRLTELSLGKPLPRLDEKGFDANGVRLKRLHRDFLLQEMEWMAADFSQERKWRMKTARTLAGSVVSHHAKKASRSARQEKHDEDARRRTAARVGREVKKFWTKIDKIISFKVKLQSDELRKAAMDRHLKSLMAQTERYASALALAFCDTETASADGQTSLENGEELLEDKAEVVQQIETDAHDADEAAGSDSDFQVDGMEDEEDDETTIAAEEASGAVSQAAYQEELATLQDESELSLEELQAKYAMMAENGDEKEEEDEQMHRSASDDSDFDMEGDGESDDETTIALEEKTQSRGDVEDEVAKLQEESELSIEELRARYAVVVSSPEAAGSEGLASDEEEFRPSDTEAVDDETTMEIAENDEFTKDEVDEEVRLLQDESELSIDELRAKYAAMEAEASGDEGEEVTVARSDRRGGDAYKDSDDSEFEQTGTDEEDDETTIAEAERGEARTKEDVDDELNALEEENNLTVEELRARYYQDANSVDSEDEDADMTTVDEDVDTTDKEEEAIVDVENAEEDDEDMEGGAVSTYKRPFLLTSRLELREYQQAGVNWLVSMCEKRINGILADEMGLGKTIQTITMLAHLACARGVWGPHLIVVPTSCMVNWEMEFKRWCPAFKVLTYFGSAKRRKELRHGWSKLNAFHVCITSYQLVVQDAHCFKRKKWYYLILDEAHNIKNWKSLRWQTLLHFNSQRRLLLTGTPLQNNIMELWALMHFLMPHVFASRKEFTYWFQNPLSVMVEESSGAAGGDPNRIQKLENGEGLSEQQPQQQQLVAQLHGIIRPFVLRRLKKDVAKQLPGKFEHVISCSLSKRQRFLYEDFISRSSTKRALFGSGKSNASGNFMSMMNVLMQLRKVCNHPDLFEPRPIASPLDMEQLTLKVPMRCAFISDWLETPSIAWWPSSMSLPNQELSGFERFTSQRARKLLHFYDDVNLVDENLPSECSVDKSALKFNRPDVVRRLLLLAEARRAYWIEKRQHYETSARVSTTLHEPMLGADLVRVSMMPVFVSHAMEVHRKRASGKESLTLSDSLSAMVRDPIDRVQELQPIVRKAVCVVPKARARGLWLQYVGQGFSADSNVRDPAKLSRKVRMEEYVEDHLKPVATRCLDPFYESFKRTQLFFPDKRLIQFDCGKLQQLDLLLRELKRGKHRCLIFTQMSSMLNILEIFLNLHGHTYFRLDGSTKVEQRQYLMEKFNHDDKIFCFILSTRSGGLGINLTGADSVIFYDSDWNPAMDAQAQDRAHRIGQTRDVHIYRLVSEHTVEENILKKAQQKRHLDFLVMAKGEFTTEFFSKANLRELMGELDNKAEVGADEDGVARIEELNDDDEADGEEEEVSLDAIESAMAQLEDEDDVVAMRGARDEFLSEQREFDEDTNAGQGVNNDKRRVSNAGTDVSRVSSPRAEGENDEEREEKRAGEDAEEGEEEASGLLVGDSNPVQVVEKDVPSSPLVTASVDDNDSADVASVEQDTSVLDEEEEDEDYTGQGSDAEEEDEDEDEDSEEVSDDDISDEDEDARPSKRRPKASGKNKNGKRQRSGSKATSASASKRSKLDQGAINAAQEQKKREKAKERAREVEEERKLQAWKDSVSSLQHFEDSLNPVDRYALHFREDVDPLYAYVPTAEAYAQLEDDSKLLVNIEEIEAQKMVEEQQWIADGELIAGVTSLDELTPEEIEMHQQLYKKERSNVLAFHRQRQLTGEAWEMRKCAITGQLFYFNSDTREATWDKPTVLTKNEQVEAARAGGFADLPSNVLLLIFSKLRAYPDRLNGVEMVCRTWRDAARHPSLCIRVNASDFYRFQSGGVDGRGHWSELLKSVDRGETLLFGSGVYEIDEVVKIEKPIRLLAAHDAHVELQMASPHAQIQWSARGGVFCGFHVSRRHRHSGSMLQDEQSTPDNNWQHLLHVTRRGSLRAVFNDFDGNHQGNACLAVSGDPKSLLVLQHNRIFHSGSGSGVLLLQGGLVMQRNSVFQNAHSGITVLNGNAVLRRNQILSNKRFGIRLLYHANNVVIEENKVEGHACGNIDVENSGRRFVVRWNEMLKDEVENLPHVHGSVRLRTSRVEERVIQVAKPANDKVVKRRPKAVAAPPQPPSVLSSVNAPATAASVGPAIANASLIAAAAAARTPLTAPLTSSSGDALFKSIVAATVAARVSASAALTAQSAAAPLKVPAPVSASGVVKIEATSVGVAAQVQAPLPQPTGSVADQKIPQVVAKKVESSTSSTPTVPTSLVGATTPVPAAPSPAAPPPTSASTAVSSGAASAPVVVSVPAIATATPMKPQPASGSALAVVAAGSAATTTVPPAQAPTTVPTATPTSAPAAAVTPAPVKMRRKRKPKTEKVLVHGVELVFRDTCEKKGEKKVKRPRLKPASTPTVKTEKPPLTAATENPPPALSDVRPSIETTSSTTSAPVEDSVAKAPTSETATAPHE